MTREQGGTVKKWSAISVGNFPLSSNSLAAAAGLKLQNSLDCKAA